MRGNREDETTFALQPAAPTVPILTMRQVVDATTFSRPSIYRLLKQERFPRPIKLGRNKIGFIAAEINAWVAARPRAGADRVERKS